MVSKQISILGIPISNLNIEECVDQILKEIENTNTSQNYICTLNSDFIANIYGFGFQNIKNKELLSVIRNSSLVTPDGMPIVWLSQLLGNSLKERVTGADLIPLLADKLGKNNRSIFILGGERAIAEQAVQVLTKLNPSLKIVGVATPQISIDGNQSALVKEINQASPDVLLINLGNPKQELWFNRVHTKLNVPISIGIGGTLNFITGKVKRAPQWMQDLGFEWLYRLIQEPKRLFKRYLLDILKFGFFSLPLIPYHFFNYLLSLPVDLSVNTLSINKGCATLKIPKHFCAQNLIHVENNLKDAEKYEFLILDLTQTRHLDLEAISFFINTARDRKNLSLKGVRWNIRTLLILHKSWDILKPLVKV